MKTLPVFIFLVLFFACKQKPVDNTIEPIVPVKLNQVKLTDDFWLPRIKTIQETTIAFALEKCRIEGRMDNFLIAGGLMEGPVKGVMPFDDTDLYKIIEGASYSLISHPDAALDNLLDSLIAIIAIGQETDGYLTTYKTIDTTQAPAHWCPPGSRWEHLECSHELYNSGHLFEAAAAHHEATGKTIFLDIALKNADLLVQVFGPGKNRQVPGHQIVETGLIRLYQLTQKQEYLALAKHFLDTRGRADLHELWGPYNQDHLPVVEQDEVVGHAVRAVYMYAGMTDIAVLYNDSLYLKAVHALWKNMVNKKLYLTGGIGARHDGEAFGENYELPNLEAYSETCAAIGSVLWNQRLFLLSGEVKYADLTERTLYNGVVPGISFDGQAFFYPNPLESDGSYAFNKGACTRSAWFDCSCCPTNLIRFIPSMPSLIYATRGNELIVNHYLSNEAGVNVAGKKVQLVQQTNYPLDGKLTVVVNPEKSGKFTLKLRVPAWLRNEVVDGNLYQYQHKTKSEITLKLNGKNVEQLLVDGYLILNRYWTSGDEITLEFPMEVKRVVANPLVKNLQGHVALEYGPLVYCAEEVDNPDFWTALAANENMDVHFRPDLFGGINTLVSKQQLTLVPYYCWSNRGVGRMKVWFPNATQH